jgi:hypothetical protein
LAFLLKTYAAVKARQDVLELPDGHKEQPIMLSDIEELNSAYYLNALF